MLGLAALALAAPSVRMYGTDVVEESLICAERNAELNGLSARSYFCLPWELRRYLRLPWDVSGDAF